MKAVIVGSGNVASVLSKQCKKSGIEVVQIFARNQQEGMAIASKLGVPFASEAEDLAKADIYIVAVSDVAIPSVISKLNLDADAVVVHTAGSVSMDEIPARIRNRGVLYPVQTFSKGHNVSLKKVPILIEATNAESMAVVRTVAEALSEKVFMVNSDRRRRIHIAAVFACNFVNHMVVVSEELCAKAGVPNDMLRPLIKETIQKIMRSERAVDVQTGPAVRNDFITKSKHLEMLENEPVLQNIYKTLSQNIWETLKKT